MGKYILKRVLMLLPILFGITFLSFAMMRLAGSDVVMQQMDTTGMAFSQEVLDARRPCPAEWKVGAKSLLQKETKMI